MTPGNGPPGGGQPGGPGNFPPDWRQWRDQQRMQRLQWRMQRAEWRRQHGMRGPGPLVPGVILLIIGAVFLLNNLGIFDLRAIREYWPVIVIAFGAFHAIFPRHGMRSILWGGALMVMGGLLLAQTLGYIRGNIWEIVWPVFLIFLGLSFLLRGRAGFAGCAGTPPWTQASGPINPNRLNENTLFGGVKQRIDSQEFEGGSLSSVFAGIEMDLRGANTKLDELSIHAEAIFGGIELMLPNHWMVTVRGSGVFGGFEDQTHPPVGAPGEKRPHVIVTGSAIFGGVTVRN